MGFSSETMEAWDAQFSRENWEDNGTRNYAFSYQRPTTKKETVHWWAHPEAWGGGGDARVRERERGAAR